MIIYYGPSAKNHADAYQFIYKSAGNTWTWY